MLPSTLHLFQCALVCGIALRHGLVQVFVLCLDYLICGVSMVRKMTAHPVGYRSSSYQSPPCHGRESPDDSAELVDEINLPAGSLKAQSQTLAAAQMALTLGGVR